MVDIEQVKQWAVSCKRVNCNVFSHKTVASIIFYNFAIHSLSELKWISS